jgi:endonuclease/exonuclease/phosphatase (EEP) superfamily protein YafD
MLALKSIFFAVQLLLIVFMSLPVLAPDIKLWWLDNLINLQLQWSLLAVLSILLSLKFFKILVIPLSLLYFSIILYNFGPLYLPNLSDNKDKAVLKLAQLNISYANPNIDEIISKLLDTDYDFILIQEIADGKVGKVGRLIQTYPYSVGSNSLRTYSSRLALFSRWPITNTKIHDLGYVEGKVIEAFVKPPDSNTPIKILALHPGAPRNKDLWQLRNNTLEFIASQASGSSQQRQIVIGDINVSPWSPFFKRLAKNSRLQNCAAGHGYIPSWALYTTNHLTRLLSSAYIDHCLVSKSFNVRDKQYHYIEGSDHVLILTTLEIKQDPKQAD